MIEVKDNLDGSIDISWDENDPIESQLNHWTEEDFLELIKKELNNSPLK